ncbi:hypothetical protein [Actinomadura sp. DC4]|uniref:hypothetical protein n=1 Tax=Actinomadura sp. DC4 TaxID=3055069 RepID=UPI0025B1790C|nr:hypothetical protein [Actinomadura sp. DC4]MDN3356705.1 hypothetical protein [Actinomadura sp. DC4]
MKKLVIGGASALAVGAVGTGIYLAGPASAGGDTELAAASQQVADQVAGRPAADKSQKPGQKKRSRIRRLAQRGVHGEASVRTKKGFVQIAWQRGQVTAKSGGTLTVRSLDGTVWQWTTVKNTRVRKDGQKSSTTNLAGNDFVVIAGTVGPGNKHSARAVIVPKKVPAKATQSPTPAPTKS